jgi:hypothetical protein
LLGARSWINKWKQSLKQRNVAKAAARPPFRRKFLIEALEPRVLLSADLPVVPPPPPDPIPHEPPEVTAAHATAGDLPHAFDVDTTGLADHFAAALTPPAAQASPLEIAFVDSRIVGQEPLTMQRDGMMVVVLDAQSDGLEQISRILAHYDNVRAVHILAHGEEGRMFLGNTALDANAIEQGKVADWGKALTEDGDLLLYGCDVAAGELGIEFMQRLAGATGADVAASDGSMRIGRSRHRPARSKPRRSSSRTFRWSSPASPGRRPPTTSPARTPPPTSSASTAPSWARTTRSTGMAAARTSFASPMQRT